ncbi:peptidylprolyl isomerase [Hyunsoonleella pacifica]|uniref:Peptidylprolyl isomerase n=1 Tax=Hyunsoonleella pacifica TaxID=1080224 RepID=A0A4V2JBB3_9FLAO|nr:peptidylprolyl isomerase [Hyunsoonleella pacifica]TBN18601.1 peptidylprolyl isomerase [Hyunsoonleella pacifica]GGD03130.1 peptidyl-prolyl cis-trans isomerase [Hyunsoonleella pacifica]
MKLKYCILVFPLFFITIGFAQKQNKDVLFTIAEEPVYVSEFLRVYNKNLDLVQDESQKDVEEYLKLFVNYKLKLQEAKAQGLHEKPSYQRELGNYKKQLAKNYMTDAEVNETLVKEAYDHITTDVKANHILVRVAEDASPKDTLVAFNKISNLRERALEEGFETVRKQIHNGKTLFGEELGWFSAFKMVYKFEKSAYSTPVGNISQPFRTRFGYHIVKVLDRRKARGERTVKHIMIIPKSESEASNAEKRINEIYKKIQQGEEYEALAKEFSDDKNSAPSGGLLKPFSSGQLSVPEFEEAAFALQNQGDISKPMKTDFGWHILKLVNAKPIGAFENIKPELEQKVKKDSRSQLIEEALIAKLKQKYNIGDNTPDLSYFVSILNDDFYKRTWELPKEFKGNLPLVRIGDKQLTNADFADALLSQQKRIRGKQSFQGIVYSTYEAFLNSNLKQYQEENLENENEDFAHIFSEYRDGLLLFDLMENTIWKSAKTDSVEVKEFYETHKEKYKWPVRVEAEVASSTNKKIIKKVAKLMGENMSAEDIKALVNTNGKVNVIFTIDTMGTEHQALPKNFDLTKGISKVCKHNNGFVVANVSNVFPEKQKPYEEVKGLVISDYQTHKENLWLEELKNKYKVVINTDVFKKVKADIN